METKSKKGCLRTLATQDENVIITALSNSKRTKFSSEMLKRIAKNLPDCKNFDSLREKVNGLGIKKIESMKEEWTFSINSEKEDSKPSTSTSNENTIPMTYIMRLKQLETNYDRVDILVHICTYHVTHYYHVLDNP